MVAKNETIKTKRKLDNAKCELCKKKYSRTYRLAQHMLQKHNVVWVKKKIVATPDNPRPFNCDDCEKTFIRRKHLMRHRISKHIGLKCTECNMKFVKLKEHMMNAHQKRLQLPFECYLCKQQYKSKQRIASHMQAIHCQLNQTFRCPLCPEVFKCRLEYQRHRAKHKYDRARFNKRICEICGKSILNSHFRNHEKTHIESHLKCSFCDKLFKNKASVKLHERTHTQERPYECEVCHSRFIDGSTLRIHRRNHTGESPFLCHLCGRRTKQAQNLASHYRHFHRNTDVTSKIIRFNSRVFERYSNEELERCLREDGDLTRLLAAGTIEYTKELEEQNRAKELEERLKFEEMQKQNAAARVYQRDVTTAVAPAPKTKSVKLPAIKRTHVNVDECSDGGDAEDPCQTNENEFTVKCEEIEFAEVKIEPTLDGFNEADDYDMSDFVATYEIKAEEPIELNDGIDASEMFKSDLFFADDASTANPNEPTSSQTKMEEDPSEQIVIQPPIDFVPISIDGSANRKSVPPLDKESMLKLSWCHICDRHYANPSNCAAHMLQVHDVKQPDILRPYKCLLCEKSYGRSSHLWRHHQKTHGGVPDRKLKNLLTVMRKRKLDIEVVEASNEDEPDPDLRSATDDDEMDVDTVPEPIEVAIVPDKETILKMSHCHICDRKYSNQVSCATHMLEVHQIQLPEVQRSHKCLLCDKSYIKSNHLGRHYRRAHNDAASRHLKIKIKTDQTLGNTSMEIVQQDVKTSCNLVPESEHVKSEVTKPDTDGLVPPSYCDICDRRYTSRSNLLIHMWGVHKIRMTPSRPFRCVISTCKKTYKTKNTLLRHYRKEHKGNPEVKGGSKMNKTTESDNENVKTEMPEEVVESKARSACLLCDKRYANHWACAAHMLQVHKIVMPDVERPFECHKCQKSYVKRGHLARHIKSGHGIGLKRKGKQAITFECYVCHESFTVREMLKKHMNKIHLPAESSSICPTCGISTQQLGRHIRRAHQPVKEARCDICQRVYSHPSRLRNHMRTHTLPAQCDLCPKRFPTNGAMRQHRRYHTLEKPFACKHCGARFIERSTCTQHERIHTGEKPYRCHLCDTRTIQAGNLKSHYRHFHKMIVRHVSMTKLVKDEEMIPIM